MLYHLLVLQAVLSCSYGFLPVQIFHRSLVSDLGEGRTAYNKTVVDVLGGVTHLSWNAKSFGHVVSLDTNLYVRSTGCESDGLMTVEVRDVRAVRGWAVGTIFTSLSGSYECANPASRDYPNAESKRSFLRKVLAVRGVVWSFGTTRGGGSGGNSSSSSSGPPMPSREWHAASLSDIPFSELPPVEGEERGDTSPYPARITFLTEDVGYNAAFEHMELRHTKRSGPMEEALFHASNADDAVRRGLLILHTHHELKREDPLAAAAFARRLGRGSSPGLSPWDTSPALRALPARLEAIIRSSNASHEVKELQLSHIRRVLLECGSGGNLTKYRGARELDIWGDIWSGVVFVYDKVIAPTVTAGIEVLVTIDTVANDLITTGATDTQRSFDLATLELNPTNKDYAIADILQGWSPSSLLGEYLDGALFYFADIGVQILEAFANSFICKGCNIQLTAKLNVHIRITLSEIQVFTTSISYVASINFVLAVVLPLKTMSFPIWPLAGGRYFIWDTLFMAGPVPINILVEGSVNLELNSVGTRARLAGWGFKLMGSFEMGVTYTSDTERPVSDSIEQYRTFVISDYSFDWVDGGVNMPTASTLGIEAVLDVAFFVSLYHGVVTVSLGIKPRLGISATYVECANTAPYLAKVFPTIGISAYGVLPFLALSWPAGELGIPVGLTVAIGNIPGLWPIKVNIPIDMPTFGVTIADTQCKNNYHLSANINVGMLAYLNKATNYDLWRRRRLELDGGGGDGGAGLRHGRLLTSCPSGGSSCTAPNAEDAYWSLEGGFSCNVDCGLGFETLTALCRNASTGLVVSDYTCDGIAAPWPATAPCVRSCFGGLQTASGVFSNSPLLAYAPSTNSSRVYIGQVISSTDPPAVWYYNMSHAFSGFALELSVVDGDDALVTISSEDPTWSPIQVSASSLTANESIALSSALDGISPSSQLTITTAYASLSETESSEHFTQYVLRLRAFQDLEEAEPLVIDAVNLEGGAFLRFFPVLGAGGVTFTATSSESIEPIVIYASFQEDGWPTTDSHSFMSKPLSNSSSASSPSSVSSSLTIDGPTFRANTFLYITLSASPSAAQVVFSATSIRELSIGDLGTYSASGSNLAYFRISFPTTSTAVVIQTQGTAGYVNLYASLTPFETLPYFVATGGSLNRAHLICASCLWSSESNAEQDIDTITITNLDLHWGNFYYIAVGSPFYSEFRIVAQAYEALDQGVRVRRSQPPSSTAYYLGAPASPNSEEELLYSLNLNVLHATASPGAIFASAISDFDATGGDPSAPLQSPLLSAGGEWSTRNAYLPNSPIARPMLVSIQTDFHGLTVPDYLARQLREGATDAPASGGSSDSPSPPLGLSTRGLSLEGVGAASEGALAASSLSGRLLQQQQQRSSLSSPSFSYSNTPVDPSVASSPSPGLPDVDAYQLFLPYPLQSSLVIEVYYYSYALESWTLVGSCSVHHRYELSEPCLNVDYSEEQYSYFRFNVPPRTFVQVAINPLIKSDGSVDAPYTIATSADTPPSVSGSDAPISPAADMRIQNCRYISRNFFLMVGNNNGVSLPPLIVPSVLFEAVVTGAATGNLCPAAFWVTTDFSACSAVCGNGTMARAVSCQDALGKMYEESFCNADIKPSASAVCVRGKCDWDFSEWTPCSVPCGGGTQRRIAQCRDGNGNAVAAENCDASLNIRLVDDCNTATCPSAFWLTSDWSACSVDCGDGGVQVRSATCSSPSATTPGTFNSLSATACTGQRPKTVMPCTPGPCAVSSYDLVYYDTREVLAAVPVVDSLRSKESLFYTFEVPAPLAAYSGLCITATPALDSASFCTPKEQARASSCIATMYACYDAAALNATLVQWSNDTLTQSNSNVSSPYTTYISPRDWLSGGASDAYNVPSGACACFATAALCLNSTSCNVSTTQAALSDLCFQARVCNATPAPLTSSLIGSTLACDQFVGDVPSLGEPTLELRAYPMDLFEAAANPFDPPQAQGGTALWGGPSSDPRGTQHLYLPLSAIAAMHASAIIISVSSTGPSITSELTVTPTPVFPGTISGTLATSTVNASTIRSGGATLVISLSCDKFINPRVPMLPALSKSFNVSEAAAANNSRTTPNVIALGLLAYLDMDRGWNRLARPFLLSPTLPPFATLDEASNTLTLTLPPIPSYDPISDDQLNLIIPSVLLQSGKSTQLPYLLTIIADRAYCSVSDWSEWSPCSSRVSSCAAGTQSRSRTASIVGVLKASAPPPPCPPLTEMRRCNPCDPCSGITCSNGGICAGGQCACSPYFMGPECSAPMPTSATSFISAGPWSGCSRACGSGLDTRRLTCYSDWNSTELYPVSVRDPLCQVPFLPPQQRVCNTEDCSSTLLHLEFTLQTSLQPTYGTKLYSVSQIDAIVAALAGEMSSLLTISQRLYGGAVVASNTSAGALFNVSITVQPAGSYVATAASAGGAGLDLGIPTETALGWLSYYANVPGSALYSSGTYLRQAAWAQATFMLSKGIARSIVAEGLLTSVEPIVPALTAAEQAPAASIWTDLAIGLLAGVVAAVLLSIVGGAVAFKTAGFRRASAAPPPLASRRNAGGRKTFDEAQLVTVSAV